MTTTVSLFTPCPCGSGTTFGRCCGPLHAGAKQAETAEQLMRSRFTAYVVADGPYLQRTWHSRTRSRELDLDLAIRWTGLTIVDTVNGGVDDDTGIVRFRAAYLVRGEASVMVERSGFEREDGHWRYVGELVKASPARP